MNGVPTNEPGPACRGQVPDFVERARALAPLIARASPRIERDCALPADVLEALHDARMFRMLLPRSCDGAELEPVTFVQAIEEIAKADASTAWCIGQASGCTIAAAHVKPEVARAVFGEPQAVMASGPTLGRAVLVEGGYRVSGTWAFASGIRHSNWLGAHCALFEADGTPLRSAEGAPLERTMLLPKERAVVKTAWDVIGLRGTGSDTFIVDDLFVPADFSFSRVSDAERREPGPLYQFTIFHIFAMAFAGVALGIARATLDAFIALAAEKIPRAGGRLLRESPVIQSQVAIAEAQWRAGRTLLLDTVRDMWASAVAERPFTLEQKARLRLVSTYAIHQAREVVDMAYHAAGATAIFESNPFERRFRDMHTASQQLQGHFANYELVGQCLLGIPPTSKYL